MNFQGKKSKCLKGFGGDRNLTETRNGKDWIREPLEKRIRDLATKKGRHENLNVTRTRGQS